MFHSGGSFSCKGYILDDHVVALLYSKLGCASLTCCSVSRFSPELLCEQRPVLWGQTPYAVLRYIQTKGLHVIYEAKTIDYTSTASHTYFKTQNGLVLLWDWISWLYASFVTGSFFYIVYCRFARERAPLSKSSHFYVSTPLLSAWYDSAASPFLSLAVVLVVASNDEAPANGFAHTLACGPFSGGLSITSSSALAVLTMN